MYLFHVDGSALSLFCFVGKKKKKKAKDYYTTSEIMVWK